MRSDTRKKGVPLRVTFIVDSEGIIRFVRVNDLSAGGGEVLRVPEAPRSRQLSPCEWHSGEPTLAVA